MEPGRGLTDAGSLVPSDSSSGPLMNQPGPAPTQEAATDPSGLAILMYLTGAASTASLRRRRRAESGLHSGSVASQAVEQTCS